MNNLPIPRQFSWYDLLTTDIDASLAFYSGVTTWLGREVGAPGQPRYPKLFNSAGAVCGVLALPVAAAAQGASAYWTGYVEVDDVDATVARAGSVGSTIYAPPADSPNGRYSVFADPNGALLGVYAPSMTLPSSPPTPGAIVWHELLAADTQAASAFYTALFGWQATESEDGTIRFGPSVHGPSETFASVRSRPDWLPVDFWLYHIGVADIGATRETVTELGGKDLEGLAPAGVENQTLTCLDPTGALVGFKSIT